MQNHYLFEVEPNQTIDMIDPGFEESTYNESSYEELPYGSGLYSEVRYHVFENGRRYHGYREGTYCLPNDQEEQDRLDLQHHIFRLTLNGELGLAPLRNPQRVLDLGCGTGIWAIDFADKYPSAHVIGVDLSPIQPVWVPPNCAFEVDDIEAPWIWAPNSFDYIHIRSLAGFLKDWPKLLAQIYRTLRPGGYVEFQDKYDLFRSDDNSVHPSSSLLRWIESWRQAASISKRPWLEVSSGFDRMLAEAGFVDIQKQSMKVPVGPWKPDKRGKELGLFSQRHEYDGAESLTIGPFTRTLGWEVAQVQSLIKQVHQELRDSRVHAHITYGFYLGMKPLNG